MQSGLMYKKWFYILLSNTKCQEISNNFFLETPLPKKLTKFFEGLLPYPLNCVRRESFIEKMAKKKHTSSNFSSNLKRI